MSNPFCNCFFDTQIIFNHNSCEGLFIFNPDLYASLCCDIGCNKNIGATGDYGNTSICPLNVNILRNCKGDYKISLLGDDGNTLQNLILKCSQYKIEDISSNPFPAIQDFYVQYGKSQIFLINITNRSLASDYIDFEKAAYYYRNVKISYQNLWCNYNQISCDIITTTDEIIQTIILSSASSTDIEQRQVCCIQDLFIKMRLVALKELCKCGRTCNTPNKKIHTK
jgi:hypothetical protein